MLHESQEKTGPEKYSVGVDHLLTQASTRMSTFLHVSSTGVHLDTELDPARKYSLGDRGRLWIPVELVSEVSETRAQSWIFLGDRPSANPSFYTDGHAFTRVKHRSSLGHRIRSRRSPGLRAGKRCGNQESGFPEVRIEADSRIATRAESRNRMMYKWTRE